MFTSITWQYVSLLYAGILGAAIGSFLNVVILRVHAGVSLSGRSHCPHCGEQLRWFDLIPIISYVVLLARCRNCKASIHWQYPLVEATTAALFILYTSVYFATPLALLLWLIAASLLVILFVYDLRYMQLPDQFTVPLIIVGASIWLVTGGSWVNMLVGAGIGGGFFLLQYVVSRGRWIGDGDIVLGIGMGALLGFPVIISALAVAYLSGSVFAIAIILLRKRSMADKLPFGTFLVFGTIIASFFGQNMIDWYLGLLY